MTTPRFNEWPRTRRSEAYCRLMVQLAATLNPNGRPLNVDTLNATATSSRSQILHAMHDYGVVKYDPNTGRKKSFVRCASPEAFDLIADEAAVCRAWLVDNQYDPAPTIDVERLIADAVAAALEALNLPIDAYEPEPEPEPQPPDNAVAVYRKLISKLLSASARRAQVAIDIESLEEQLGRKAAQYVDLGEQVSAIEEDMAALSDQYPTIDAIANGELVDVPKVSDL